MSVPLLRSETRIQELKDLSELDSLLRQDLVVIFKHSSTCPVSWMAHHQVSRFRSAHPDVPVYLLSVRKQRDVSSEIARRTGVTHESPQILVFRNGNVSGSASHDEITADLLRDLTGLVAA